MSISMAAPTTKDLDKAMRVWFPSAVPLKERKPFREADLNGISQALAAAGQDSWSRTPRLYATLRTIDSLSLLDSFLAQGLTDVWFPFSPKSLPESLKSPAARADFIEAQKLVLTKGLFLEKENSPHRHFSNVDDIPLEKIEFLGRGGFGYVEKVISTISGRIYARKLIQRGVNFQRNKQVLKDFEAELSSLKKLSHEHIIELIASYTDPKYVVIVMYPVADGNLKEFLEEHPLSTGKRSCLARFFGCLVAATSYLHENRIRHKDIKPQNILVKGEQIYLTDFGISRDWTDFGHSTTTGPTRYTPKYCAPEVAAYEPRNTSSDVWSLGCVFLEMWTVLCGESLASLTSFFQTHGARSSNYHQNPQAIKAWCDEQLSKPENADLSLPHSWILMMLESEQTKRCKSHSLLLTIQESAQEHQRRFEFIGICCGVDEDTAESVQSSEFEFDSTEVLTLDTTSRTYPSGGFDDRTVPSLSQEHLHGTTQYNAASIDATTTASDSSNVSRTTTSQAPSSQRPTLEDNNNTQQTLRTSTPNTSGRAGRYHSQTTPAPKTSGLRDTLTGDSQHVGSSYSEPSRTKMRMSTESAAPPEYCLQCKLPIGGSYAIGPRGTKFHPEHFHCMECNIRFSGQEFIYIQHDGLLCWFDYVIQHADICRGCGIFLLDNNLEFASTSADGQRLTYLCKECQTIRTIVGSGLEEVVDVTKVREELRSSNAERLKEYLQDARKAGQETVRYLEIVQTYAFDCIEKATYCPQSKLDSFGPVAIEVLTMGSALVTAMGEIAKLKSKSSISEKELINVARTFVEGAYHYFQIITVVSPTIMERSDVAPIMRSAINEMLRWVICWTAPPFDAECNMTRRLAFFDTLVKLFNEPLPEEFQSIESMTMEDLDLGGAYSRIWELELHHCFICRKAIAGEALYDEERGILHPDCLVCEKCGFRYRKGKCFCGSPIPEKYEPLSALQLHLMRAAHHLVVKFKKSKESQSESSLVSESEETNDKNISDTAKILSSRNAVEESKSTSQEHEDFDYSGFMEYLSQNLQTFHINVQENLMKSKAEKFEAATNAFADLGKTFTETKALGIIEAGTKAYIASLQDAEAHATKTRTLWQEFKEVVAFCPPEILGGNTAQAVAARVNVIRESLFLLIKRIQEHRDMWNTRYQMRPSRPQLTVKAEKDIIQSQFVEYSRISMEAATELVELTNMLL